MSSNTIKYDDPFAFIQPVQDGETAIAYPFIQNGDRATVVYTRTLLQREAYYRPIAPGAETDSVWPGGDPKAYNFPDSTPVRVGVGDLLRFTRSYSRIPAAQVNYPGSVYVSFPSLYNKYTINSTLTAVDIPTGASLGDGYYLGGASYTAADYKMYRSKTITATTYGKATAGTFTITYGANTTAALNWNDAGATIATAVNALGSVSGDGLTTTWTNTLSTAGILIVTIALSGSVPANWPKYFTATVSSLTVSTSQHAVTVISTGNAQYIYLPDHHTITSHGFDTAKRLSLGLNNARLLSTASGSWGSVDANTIWFPTTSDATIQAGWAGDYTADIDATGTRLVRTRTTETFSLPGVTTGITTPADIAVSAGMQNPTDFYYALANSSGWQTYATSGPARWNGGPIYRLETTEINLADLY